ncbi:MAG: AI-2E family transporter, partial [Chloroflexia bacterium]|nr:AI-2E family transporter [Chloroflexia bacterium]
GLAFLVALTESWQKAVIVLIFVVILQQLEGNVIVPRVMQNAVGLTPLSVLLAVLVGGSLLGPLGAILAIPVAAAVQVLISELLRTREETDDEAQRPFLGRSARTPAVHPEVTGGPSVRPVTMTATSEGGARPNGGGATPA